MSGPGNTARETWLSPDQLDLAEFERLISRALTPEQAPHAAEIVARVPIYDMAELRPSLEHPSARPALMAEWANVLMDTAGVLVLRRAYEDTAPVDRATQAFRAIIAEERTTNGGGSDHFAKAGANDRIWNSLQKLCLRDPACFAEYFGNAAIAAVCEAWLGPDYQMTAQVNQVRPGGTAQNAHRDYHLGFQRPETAARYPGHVHDLSATLTLQGAVAHSDMPIESGPTKLLPFSQLFRAGYLAFHDPAFRKVFEERAIQLPLAKGDAVFFNPALFHAAGANTSAGIYRMANLLQVSSAFGRAMETVDREAMCIALYPTLQSAIGSQGMSPARIDAAVAACAEGYPFPSNLDTDPPVGGNAPESQAALMRRAMNEGWSLTRFQTTLAQHSARRKA